jgi:hypothetical protein
MPLSLKWNAALKHPLSREKRREFRRQARRALDEPRLRLEQATARGKELEAALVALRTENAELAERVAIAADLRSVLAPVGAQLGDARDRLTATLGAQVADARDRLAGRLEILTSELGDMRRTVASAGRHPANRRWPTRFE